MFQSIPGVIAFYTAKDIPGKNSFTPKNIPLVAKDEEFLCSGEVKFNGQPVGIIVANREKLAARVAKIVKIKYASQSTKTPLLTVIDVLKSQEASLRIKNGKVIEPTEIGNDVKCVLYNQITFESQYHYTMEAQTCVARPTEDGLEVFSSTQWLDFTNTAVALCLNVPVNR